MKKNLLTVALVALVALIASPAFAVISGTSHDFSAIATGVGQGNANAELCIFCHTPHNADTSLTDAPLWNHALTAASFTLYTSATLNASLAQPTGISKLCLSCHDGTIGVDSFGGNTGTANISAGSTNLGTSLTDDHPVSFVYDAALVLSDGSFGLYDPSVPSGLGGTITEDLLFSTKLECASCHDVHDDLKLPFLLVKSNSGSALCITCHQK